MKRKPRLTRAATEESGKTTKGKDVSGETKAKIIHTLRLYVCNYYVQMRKPDSEEGWWGTKRVCLKSGVGGDLCGYPGPPRGF